LALFNNIESLGWNAFFESQLERLELEENTTVARVIEAQREAWLVDDGHSERWCALAGRLRHELLRPIDLPAVGDWVVVRAAPQSDRGQVIHTLLRKSQFVRKAPETGALQIVASNIDVAFIVSALNSDHNPRRIERYLTMVWESGAMPIVLLTKADLCDDVDAAVADVEAVAPGVSVVATSALTDAGMADVQVRIKPGHTAVLLGSSGVGKSTLVNALCGGMVQAVQQVSGFKDKGRHTTTARKLLHLPSGGMIIDTPGMRELQLTDAGSGVAQTFDDIAQLALSCRFSNCAHQSEPGCAINAALHDGRLDHDRYKSYQKLQREAAYEARKEDVNLARLEKERWKKIHSAVKRRPPKWML
jgi:ribosome biogenesis GTPase